MANTATPGAQKSRLCLGILHDLSACRGDESGHCRSEFPVGEITAGNRCAIRIAHGRQECSFGPVGAQATTPPMPPRPLAIGPAGHAAAQAIERTRTARGYSQRQLAARVTALGRPMTFTALSRIERTVRRCDIDDLVTIAAALGIAPQALLAGTLTSPRAAGLGEI
ncbi:helix-turn-helix domain-containing protein [Streptomyces hydrogenans]|uniref:helix-turn-helix domain-containing protein n=1 Tax=Streptomyces hydrogenans TaxID=1873719 RepID=UPI00367903B0